MPPADRVAFLASFTRFVLEMLQQVSEILVHSDPNFVPGQDLEDDHVMMMQGASRIVGDTRRIIADLQNAPERDQRGQGGRAKTHAQHEVPRDLLGTTPK